MDKPRTDTRPVAGELVELLPELALALYESGPHGGSLPPAGEPLTGRQMMAVIHLAGRGRLTMSEFAAEIESSRSAATELADRLVAKGLARREPDPADRRVTWLIPAGRAERCAVEALALWRERLDGVLARCPGLDPTALVTFIRTLIADLRGQQP